MKFLKITAVLFCFTLSINIFKDGIPSYSSSTNYTGFIAALILFIIGIALLVNLVITKFKPVNGYSEYIKQVKAKKLSNDLAAIEQKIKLLEQSYNDGILNKNEFTVKMDCLKDTKDSIENKKNSEKEFNHKKKNLLKLHESKIITKDEFGAKINAIRSELQLDSDYCVDPTIDEDTKIYYVSDCEEHGPIPISYLVYLLETGEINPNCFYKLQNEETYSHRVRELQPKLAS